MIRASTQKKPAGNSGCPGSERNCLIKPVYIPHIFEIFVIKVKMKRAVNEALQFLTAVPIPDSISTCTFPLQ